LKHAQHRGVLFYIKAVFTWILTFRKKITLPLSNPLSSRMALTEVFTYTIIRMLWIEKNRSM
jgi:hypothetical protein